MKLFVVTFEALKTWHPAKPPILTVGDLTIPAKSPEEAVNIALQREPMITRIFHTVWI